MSSGEGADERVQSSSGGRPCRSLRGRSGRATVPDRQAGSACPARLRRRPVRKPAGNSGRERCWQRAGTAAAFRSRCRAAPGRQADRARSKVAAVSPAVRSSSRCSPRCSRILGLLRTVVFAQTVGSGCLGTAYVTANQVPNLIYELAIGGALTSAMVPVLARSAARAAADPAGEGSRRADLLGAAHLVGRDPAAAHRGHRLGRAPDRRAAEPGQPERRRARTAT